MKAKIGVWIAACVLPLASWAGQVAYLGVATEPLEPRLARHLGLPKGVGLEVAHIDENGVLKGKVEEGDVLHKLNDQLLVGPEQLAILVRMQKPGDEVALTVVRRGKSEEIKVKAGGIDESEAWQPGQDTGLRPRMWNFQGPEMPQGWENWFNDLQERMRNAERPWRGRGGPALRAEDDDDDAGAPAPRKAAPPRVESRVQTSSSSVVSESRDGLSVTLTVRDGDKHFKAVEDGGNVVYDGPVNTPDEVKKVPEKARERLQNLEKSVKIEVQGGGSARPAKPGAAMRLHAL